MGKYSTFNSDIKVAVDAVIFGYHEKQLQVLLVRRKGSSRDRVPEDSWALPGGFVRVDESIEEALERELKEETNIAIAGYEQLRAYGEVRRDPRCRVVTIAYFAIVRPDQYTIIANTDACDVKWFDSQELPLLEFDHAIIIKDGIDTLRRKITTEPIGFDLLKRNFPFSDLENLYSVVLGQSVDRRNFRKKILSLGILTEIKEKREGGVGRPPMIYRFSKSRYFDLKKKGFHVDFWRSVKK